MRSEGGRDVEFRIGVAHAMHQPQHTPLVAQAAFAAGCERLIRPERFPQAPKRRSAFAVKLRSMRVPAKVSASLV